MISSRMHSVLVHLILLLNLLEEFIDDREHGSFILDGVGVSDDGNDGPFFDVFDPNWDFRG